MLLRCVFTGLRCSGTEMGDAEAMKLAAAVPFRQSLVAVDGAGDEAADNKVTFLFCTQLVCCIACVPGTVWLCLDGGWRSCCGSIHSFLKPQITQVKHNDDYKARPWSREKRAVTVQAPPYI